MVTTYGDILAEKLAAAARIRDSKQKPERFDQKLNQQHQKKQKITTKIFTHRKM